MKVEDVHIIMKFQQEKWFCAKARDGNSRPVVSSRKVHPGKVKRAIPSAFIAGAITATAMAWSWRNELISFGSVSSSVEWEPF